MFAPYRSAVEQLERRGSSGRISNNATATGPRQTSQAGNSAGGQQAEQRTANPTTLQRDNSATSSSGSSFIFNGADYLNSEEVRISELKSCCTCDITHLVCYVVSVAFDESDVAYSCYELPPPALHGPMFRKVARMLWFLTVEIAAFP